MNQVDKVKELCKERGITIAELERECGFSNGYIRRLRKGVFPMDRLMKIADFFGVTYQSLLGISDKSTHDYAAVTGDLVIPAEIQKALSSPNRNLLLAYAKMLNTNFPS